MRQVSVIIGALASALTAVMLAVPAAAGQAGMAEKGDLTVSEAWIRAGLPNRPTAGYLMVKNDGSTADRLIAVKSATYPTVELHESKMVDGVMMMEPVKTIPVPAGGMAMLEPGGLHLMLFGGPGLKEGAEAELTLVFETAGEVTVTFPVKKGSASHSGHGGHGHGHGHSHGTKKE